MAQGTIRVRCAVCRKSGAKEKDCKIHSERVYQALFPIPGTKKQEAATYPTHNDSNKPSALQQAKLFLAEKQILYSKNPEYKKPKKADFAEISAEFLSLKKASPDVDIKTWTVYKRIVHLHIDPFFKNMPLSSIKENDAQKVVDDAKKHSKSTLQKVSFLMKGIFKLARRKELITADPSENLEWPRQKNDAEYQILEPEMVRDFFYVLEDNLFLKLYIKLPIVTGLRAAEVAGLPVNRIHFDKREIEVSQVVKWYSKSERADIGHNKPWKIVPKPKTPAGFRRVPISEDMLKDLQIFLIDRPENPYNLLFANQHGEPIRHSNFFKMEVKPAFKKAGLPPTKYHELRHTFCALMCAQIGQGTDLGLVKYYMGHKKSDVTLDIYNKVLEKNKRAGSKIADVLEQSIFQDPRVSPVSVQSR